MASGKGRGGGGGGAGGSAIEGMSNAELDEELMDLGGGRSTDSDRGMSESLWWGGLDRRRRESDISPDDRFNYRDLPRGSIKGIKNGDRVVVNAPRSMFSENGRGWETMPMRVVSVQGTGRGRSVTMETVGRFDFNTPIGRPFNYQPFRVTVRGGSSGYQVTGREGNVNSNSSLSITRITGLK